MNMPSSEAIPFNVFYLMEFFNATLNKMQGKVADSHRQILKNLSSYLLKEDTIVEGLEKVAKYQTTNDLAIFLFDMLERANDFGPANVVGAIPDLAEDFVNLYSLMVEDEESVKTLNQVVEDFQSKFGELEKEQQLEEFIQMARAGDTDEAGTDEKEITFSEFYQEELIKKIAAILNRKNVPESAALLFVCQTMLRFCEQNLAEQGNYSYEIEKLNAALQPYIPGASSFNEIYEKLDDSAQNVYNLIDGFKNNHPRQFEEILQKGKVEQTPEDAQQPAKKSKEISGLDTLLVQYFRTEVEDFIEDINKVLQLPDPELNADKNIAGIVKNFKALKEVSMIHGYSGLEHIAHVLINEFSGIKDSDNRISAESISILNNIFEDIVNVENYHDKSDKDAVEAIVLKINELKSSFTPAEEVVEEASVEEEPEAATEVTVGIEDHSEFQQIVRDFLIKIRQRISDLHQNIDSPQTQTDISGIISLLKTNASLYHPDFIKSFCEPLSTVYENIFKSEQSEEKATWLEGLNQAWDQITNTALDDVDFDTLQNFISNLPEKEKTAAVFGIDDAQIISAFSETLHKLWGANKDNFISSLKGNDDSFQSITFLENLKANLSILNLTNYLPFVDFLTGELENSKSRPLNDEISAEFENAFKLFLERLEHKGKNGDCTDIIAALHDVLEEIKTVADEPVTEKPAEEAAPAEPQPDDDLALFKEETKEYLDIISSSLQQFADDKDRMQLVEIENACHSLRSAAHYLGLKNISKLAATLEEAAELFGQSDLTLPNDLDKTLKNGLQTLEQLIENPETDFSATQDELEALLDNIVIEDNVTATEKEETFELDKKTADEKPSKSVEEKPLFAGAADEDEELLQIFKEESATFLSNIQDANNTLLENPDDEKAADVMGYASHSLKSAAKMLGFREISQITDSLENITDAINKKEVKHNSDLHAKIEVAIEILEKLSEGEASTAADISNIIYDLELQNWKVTEEVTDEDDDQLPENMLEIYVDEAREIISGLNKDFLELEKMPESELVLAAILRRMHTLKGSSYISKFNHVGDLAHKMEDYFQLYKQKDGLSKNDMLDPAFLALDLITEIVDHINETGNENIAQITTRIAEIDNKMFLFQNFGEAPADYKPVEESKSVAESKTTRKKKAEEENIIKISTEYMDKLVDMASELMINQTQLGAYLHSLKDVLSDIEGEKKQIHGAENILEDAIEFGVLSSDEQNVDASQKAEEVKKISENIKDVVRAVNMIHGDLNKLTEGLEQNIGRISSISKLLHSDMLKTRMVPVENLFNRYPRAVRDMASKQKKKVNLVIEDNNTEMDRAMVEGLAEPILHIIRNAIDHGLETPKERQDAKKADTGTLLLKARQEKNQIVIDIEDDGRGIDLDILKEKILEKNLAEPEQVDKMSDAEVLDYIFYSEFTTRDEATDVSGRGIGLDAVSTQIQKLKGNIRVKTEKNVGTSFSLRVPLTLVISQALMVKVNLQSIAIPVIAVQESIQFSKNDIVNDDNKKYIRVRGRLLPFVHLRDILKFSAEEPGDIEKQTQMAVVVYDAGISMALGIDELVGRQEVVIKSLGSHLQNVDYIAGGTILANGDVALILDYALVIRTIELHFFGKVSERQVARKISRKVEQEKEDKKEAQKAKEAEKSKSAEGTKKEEKTAPSKVIKKRIIKDRKPKIIIVDDSNSVRNFVGSILERNGFTTIKSNNGSDALEKMKTEKIDLMITDLEMPKMHGFDLISTIRDQNKYDDLPIIILTGRAGMKHRQTGEELGANAFIVKPFKEKDLLQSLAEFIEISN